MNFKQTSFNQETLFFMVSAEYTDDVYNKSNDEKKVHQKNLGKNEGEWSILIQVVKKFSWQTSRIFFEILNKFSLLFTFKKLNIFLAKKLVKPSEKIPQRRLFPQEFWPPLTLFFCQYSQNKRDVTLPTTNRPHTHNTFLSSRQIPNFTVSNRVFSSNRRTRFHRMSKV